MKFVIDIILVLIVLVSGFIGYKKGFMRLLLPIISFVFAIYLSFAFAPDVSSYVTEKFIQPKLVTAVSEGLSDTAGELGDKTIASVSKFTQKLGIDLEELIGSTVSSNTEDINEAALKIVEEKINPVITKPVSTVVSIILFVIFSVLLNLLARLINKIIKGSPVGVLNTAGGVCLGVAGGIVFAALFCVILAAVINFSSDGFFIFTEENAQNSVIYRYFIGLLYK